MNAATQGHGFELGPDIMFVPGDRPERFQKAAQRASVVIIDLEDAVSPDARPAAREALIASALDPATTIVRINARGTDDHELDVNAVRQTAYRYVMVPKAAVPAELPVLDGLGHPYKIVALVESALGVAQAEQLAAAPDVVAMMWGAEDLVASTEGTASRHTDGSYRELARYARARVFVAAKAYGRAAIDSVYLDLGDSQGLDAETEDAVAWGFEAKAVLHPDQAERVRAGFAPDDAQLAWARGVLAAAQDQPGAFRFEGAMVDEVVLKKARMLVRRAA